MQAAPLASSALTSPAKIFSEIFGRNEVNDGFIVITKKVGGTMRHVSSFETTREEEVDSLIQHRGYDYYFAKAQMIRPGSWCEENVFAFNAIYLDLDAHDRQIDLDCLERVVVGLIEEDGTIPCPNIVLRSGRGLHLIWTIGQYPACFAPTVKRVTQHFAAVVASLLDESGFHDFRGLVDFCACANIAGLTRLPGGTNTKNGAAVTYRVLNNQHIDFNAALDTATASAKSAPKRKMCVLASLGERRMRAIAEASVENCGPDSIEGFRDLTLFHYCAAARTAGYDAATAMQKCHALNATFAKPLTDREVDSYLSTAKTGKYNRITNRRIIEDLAIDNEIQRQCGLTGTTRKNHNRARDCRRKSKKEERNAKIVELHEQGMTNAAIACEMGCHHDTVRAVLAKIHKKDDQSHRIYTSVATSIEVPNFQNLNSDNCQKWKSQIVGYMASCESTVEVTTSETTPSVGESEYIDLGLKGSIGYVDPATAEFKKVLRQQATVQFNSHVSVGGQNYSVPYEYIGQQVEVRLPSNKVDIFVGGDRVASHARLLGRKGQYATNPAHMPDNPRVLAWNSERFIRWARQIGHSTETAIRSQFARAEIEQQRYKSTMAILRLAKIYGTENLEFACQILNSMSAYVSVSKLKPLLELKSADGR